jgi:hypothetical protein
MSQTIRVSAKILRWPPVCPCCGDKADASLEIKARKVNEEGEAQYRSWEVPYCSTCLKHIRLFKRFERAQSEGMAVQVLTWLLCAAAIAGLVYFAVESKMFWLCVFAVPIACLAAFCSYRFYQSGLATTEAAEHAALEAQTPRCCLSERAVDYNGWNGSVHEFTFYSTDYAKAFVAANAKKVIGCLLRRAVQPPEKKD